MLEEKLKIEHLKKYLSVEQGNYGDRIKFDMFFELFELENFKFDFLKELKTIDEIENKIEFIVSKIILNEDKTGFKELLSEFIE